MRTATAVTLFSGGIGKFGIHFIFYIYTYGTWQTALSRVSAFIQPSSWGVKGLAEGPSSLVALGVELMTFRSVSYHCPSWYFRHQFKQNWKRYQKLLSSVQNYCTRNRCAHVGCFTAQTTSTVIRIDLKPAFFVFKSLSIHAGVFKRFPKIDFPKAFI